MSDPEPHGLHELTSAHLADKAAFGDAGAFAVLVERHRVPVWATAALATGDGPTATDVTGRAFVRTLATVAAGVHDPAVPIDRALVGVALEMALDARTPEAPSGVELPAPLAAAPPADRVAGWLGGHEGWPAEHVEALLATATADRIGAAPAPVSDTGTAASAVDLAPPPDLASAVAHAWQEWQGVDLGIPERHPWAVALARLDAPLGHLGDAVGRTLARAGTRASRGVTSRRAGRRTPCAPDLPPPPDLLPVGADDHDAEPVDVADAALAAQAMSPLRAPGRADRIRHLGAAPAAGPAVHDGAATPATTPVVAEDPPPSSAPTPHERPVPAAAPGPAAAADDVIAADEASAVDDGPDGGAPDDTPDRGDAEVHVEALLGPRSDGLDLPERWRRPQSLVVAGTTPTRTRVIAAVAAGILTAGAVGSLLAAPTATAPPAQADEVAAGAPTPTGEGSLLDDADLVPAAAVTPDGEPDARPDPSAPGGPTERPGGGTSDRADRRGATTDPVADRPGTGGTDGPGESGGGDAPTAAAEGAPSSGGAGAADGGGGTPTEPSAPSTPAAPPTTAGPAPTTAPTPAPTTTPAPPPTTEPPAPPTTAPAPPTTQPRPVCGLLPVLCPGGGLIP